MNYYDKKAYATQEDSKEKKQNISKRTILAFQDAPRTNIRERRCMDQCGGSDS